MKMIVADDHPMVRTGLAQILSGLADQVDVFEAADFDSLKVMLLRHPEAELVLVDLDMPGMHGARSITQLASCAVSVPIVVVSASDNPRDVREALAAGAMGFIQKQERAATLLGALRLILAGGVYVPPGLSSAPVQPEIDASLTARQREVLAMLAEGRTNKEIARLLGVAEQTVKGHLLSIFRQIKVSNRVQAAQAARRWGL